MQHSKRLYLNQYSFFECKSRKGLKRNCQKLWPSKPAEFRYENDSLLVCHHTTGQKAAYSIFLSLQKKSLWAGGLEKGAQYPWKHDKVNNFVQFVVTAPLCTITCTPIGWRAFLLLSHWLFSIARLLLNETQFVKFSFCGELCLIFFLREIFCQIVNCLVSCK